MPSTRKFKVTNKREQQLLERRVRHIISRAAEETPTAAGLQLYSVIMVQEGFVKAGLSRFCRHQRWIFEAPMLLVFCADIHRFEQWLHSNGQDSHYRSDTWLEVSKADTYLLAQAVSAKARRYGYGTCFSGFVLNAAAEIQGQLLLPSGVFPLILMAVGRPDEKPVPKRRTDPNSFIHSDRYQGTAFDFGPVVELYGEKAMEKNMTVAELFVKEFYPVKMVRDGDVQLQDAKRYWREGTWSEEGK